MITNATDAEDDLSRRLTLIKQVNAGLFEGLECPSCKHLTVSAWFTHPAESEYRTWFRCDNCAFEMRAHNTCRPVAYREDRVDRQLDQRDRLVLEKSIFKRPAEM